MPKKRKEYQSYVGRVPVVVLLTSDVYDIVTRWAGTDRCSVSKVISGMLHAGLAIPIPPKKRDRVRHGA